MRAILDTHVILWWVTNNPQLSQAVRDIIADSEPGADLHRGQDLQGCSQKSLGLIHDNFGI
jgi:hypothetical protein